MNYSLTIYVYPSPKGVNWQSPHHLTWSTVKNAITFQPRTIGHVSVLLEGPDKRIFTGMSTAKFDENRKLVIWHQMGMGVLFYEYEGMVEDEKRLQPELEQRLKSGKLTFIKFKLSEASYQKAHQYFEEYQSHNVGKIYGLPYRPRYKEGAGCSAFGASFLEVAGLMTDEFRKHWSGRVRIPQEFIGERDPKGKKVPIWKLLIPSRKNLNWAEKHEAGRDVFFWDPDLMNAWVLKQWSAPAPGFEAVKEQNAKGILVDSSKIIPTQDPIWLTES